MAPATIPACLDHVHQLEGGTEWLAALPGLVAASADHWALRLDEPYLDSYVALVAPATTGAGLPVVLKIQFPHSESDAEALALRTWDGDGAIRLIDEDPLHNALLLEQCRPGDHLSTRDHDQAIDVFVSLLPRLSVPAPAGVTSLETEVSRWVHNLPKRWELTDRPFPRRLLDAAIETLTYLADTQGEQVLVHQDLHSNNVLAAEREPWLAIDPKPLAGEREFALSPIVRCIELGHSEKGVKRRLYRLSDELGLDRERSRLWAFGQAVAWGFEGDKGAPRPDRDGVMAARLPLTGESVLQPGSVGQVKHQIGGDGAYQVDHEVKRHCVLAGANIALAFQVHSPTGGDVAGIKSAERVEASTVELEVVGGGCALRPYGHKQT